MLFDGQGRCLSVNSAGLALLGQAEGAVIGRRYVEFLHDEARPKAEEAIKSVLNGEPSFFEADLVHPNGSVSAQEVAFTPVFADDGSVLHFVGIASEASGHRVTRERLKTFGDEKELLRQEIHYRVSNNLQLISSLLNLQSSYVRDERCSELFRKNMDRIRSMALVFRKLYDSEDLSSINIGSYFAALMSGLFATPSVRAGEVVFKTDLDDIHLPVNLAIPCGLILNELVSNALEHAFPGGGRGEISVSIKSTPEGRAVLTVKDNGVGLPPGLGPENADTLGFRLVATQVEQINGRMRLESAGGTAVEITFGE